MEHTENTEHIEQDMMTIITTLQRNLVDAEGQVAGLKKTVANLIGTVINHSKAIEQLQVGQTEILDGLHELLSQSRFCEAFSTDMRALEWYNEIQKRIDPKWKPVHELPPNAKNREHRNGSGSQSLKSQDGG